MNNSIFICRFCGKKCKNTNSLIQHELRCYENPDRIVENKVEIETYEKSPKICPICGGIIPYKKRHQKTCSPECGVVLRTKNGQYTHKLKDTAECVCKYCGKICKNNNSLRNHERLCKSNPNRQIFTHNNLENYNGRKTAWNKGLTKETDERVLKGSETFRKSIESGKYIPKGKAHTEEYKEKLRLLQKETNYGHKHFVKNIHKSWNGYEFISRSSYELDYANMLDEQKINYEYETLRIKYYDTYLKVERTSIPDFYLPDSNTIVEIKSTYTLNVQNMKDRVKRYRELGYKFILMLNKKEVNVDNL
jgi:hypothetical protein